MAHCIVLGGELTRTAPCPSPPPGVPASQAALDEPLRLNRKTHFSPSLDASARSDIVHAACSRSHTLLVTRGGSVYGAGSNLNSQLALSRAGDVVATFTRIESGPWSKANDPVVQVAAGLTFSLFLTVSGRVYASGSMERGQLGNGRTGEHFVSGNRLAFAEESTPILVKGLAEHKIVEISCGQQHSIALDDQGFCYVWGFGGYGRLGLGNANDQMTPALVPQFARENQASRAASVVAGPTSSAVVDRSHTYYLAGKWKVSGDGGSGQGWTSFRYMQSLMGVKVRKAAMGGMTLFAIGDELEAGSPKYATMNIVWGQNAANGELGLGEGKPKSATQPQRCEPLDKVGLLGIAGGQNTTFFLARPEGDAFSSLPRYPEVSESSEVCLVCSKETPEDVVTLECEKCENAYHLRCLTPKLDEVPDGEWFCPECEEGQSGKAEGGEAEEAGGKGAAKGATGRGRGRGRGGAAAAVSGRGGKRKADGDAVPAAAKRGKAGTRGRA